MTNIKILISCHKPVEVLKSDILVPIQVGCKDADKRFEGMLADDDGKNISDKNSMYCELTAQYWAWQNLKADYYGFFHYRRYLNFSEKKYQVDCWGNVLEDTLCSTVLKKYGLSDASMRRIIEDNDIVISEKKDITKMPGKYNTVYEQYEKGTALHIEDMEIIRDIIKSKYPAYLDDLDEYLNSSKTCLCNMYIMKKELFCEYATWLFDILEEFEKRADMSDYSTEGLRTPGHLAERLLTLFYLHIIRTRKLKIKELQTVVFLDTEEKTKLDTQNFLQAFETNNTAIALASNDFFVPYMSTLLESILESSTKTNNYDIIILTQNISQINKERIVKMFDEQPNFKIRFINPAALISDYNLYTHGHFSMETYYRLVLPELLPRYKKVLYLDSDMIVLDDVANLYSENVDGYLLAACHDADTAGLYNGYVPGKKEYTDKILKLKEPYQYFQAGVLLMNLDEFRKQYTTEKILQFAVSEKWELLDQDILNKLCEGQVKYVDMAWNVMVDYAGIREKKIIALAPKWLNDMYLMARKNQKIIHYAGPEKPWYYPEMDQGVEFWQYARKTPYLEIMISRMCTNWYSVLKAEHARSEKHSLIKGGLRCIREHGLMYTIAYLPRKLFG